MQGICQIYSPLSRGSLETCETCETSKSTNRERVLKCINYDQPYYGASLLGADNLTFEGGGGGGGVFSAKKKILQPDFEGKNSSVNIYKYENSLLKA